MSINIPVQPHEDGSYWPKYNLVLYRDPVWGVGTRVNGNAGVKDEMVS